MRRPTWKNIKRVFLDYAEDISLGTDGGDIMSKDEFETGMAQCHLSRAALIRNADYRPCHHVDGVGVAICLGENFTKLWQSGDVIVFWPDGEHTTVPDVVEVLNWDLFR